VSFSKVGIHHKFLADVSSIDVAFLAAPVDNCNALMYSGGGLIIVAIPSTSALFFYRVKAIYNHKIVTIFFGFLLFALFGLCFLFSIAAKSGHIGPTRYCIVTHFEHYGSMPNLLHSIYDTLVFIAISLRIVSYSIVGDTFGARMRSFFRGAGLPSLSRSVLQGGQLYYLFVAIHLIVDVYQCFSSSPTIGLNILLVVVILAPVSPAYLTMFIIPHIALGSAMACRVFRGLRLGLISDQVQQSTVQSTIHFGSRSQTAPHQYNLKAFDVETAQNDPTSK
jgi:hypothetical protein